MRGTKHTALPAYSDLRLWAILNSTLPSNQPSSPSFIPSFLRIRCCCLTIALLAWGCVLRTRASSGILEPRRRHDVQRCTSWFAQEVDTRVFWSAAPTADSAQSIHLCISACAGLLEISRERRLLGPRVGDAAFDVSRSSLGTGVQLRVLCELADIGLEGVLATEVRRASCASFIHACIHWLISCNHWRGWLAGWLAGWPGGWMATVMRTESSSSLMTRTTCSRTCCASCTRVSSH